MKKLVLTFAIVLTVGISAFAQRSLLGRSEEEKTGDITTPAPSLVAQHNLPNNQNASPLGSGVVVLLGLGAAYMVAKKRKED